MSRINLSKPFPPASRPKSSRCPPATSLSSTAPVAPLGMAGLAVTNLRNQHGGFHFKFTQGVVTVGMPSSAVGNAGALGDALVAGGIMALTPQARTYAQRAAQALNPADAGRCYLADQPGHHSGMFVFPDGRVFGRCESGDVVVALETPLPLSAAGSRRGWQDTIQRFGRGQSNVIFVTALALAGMILDLVPYDGAVLIEYEGTTSLGKTTLLKAAASAWGAPSKTGSISASWRLSGPGLQHLMFARSSAFMPLDEVNTAGVNRARQAEAVGDAAFFLERGESAVHDRARTVRHARVCGLSTSNEPISRLLAGAAVRSLEAAQVRFITVPVQAGAGLGLWSNLPSGFSNPGLAADAFAEALGADHGWAAAHFAHQLVGRRRRNEAALRELLVGYIDQFLTRAELASGDGAARRRATKFAIIYAAGRLACEMCVLPFEPREIGEAVLEVFQRAQGAHQAADVARLSPPDRLRAYVAAHRAELVDLDVVPAPQLSNDELDAHVGFWRTLQGRRCLLLRGDAFRRIFGAEQAQAKSQLRKGDHLVIGSGEHFQTQAPVRDREEKSRVYAIAGVD